jgi:hypothetical protein
MSAFKTFGIALLALVWLWLCQALLRTGGINLKNLLLAAASGIIIFVPLFKKYIRNK